MKTIKQYQDDIATLVQKSAEIDAKCVQEGRDLTRQELALKNEIMDAIGELREIVGTMERQEKLFGDIQNPQNVQTVQDIEGDTGIRNGGLNARDKDTFGCFGEQMAAVMVAGKPGGLTDPRLFNAASGLNETTPSDGGFLVQQDFSNQLLQDVFETGVLASRAQEQIISGNSNSMKINGVDETSRASTRYGGIVGYWADEADEKTASKPKFRKIELNLKKLIGMCYLTDELMEDAAALESFVKNAFVGEFGFLVDDAIYNGTGGGTPLGILNGGGLVTVSKEAGQNANTLMAENLINMYSRRFAAQTANYVWLYNQNIEPQLFTMSLAVGTGGIPVYMPPGGLSDVPYGRILGLPALAIEQAASLGTVGDICLANLPNGYIIGKKGGIKTDMSIHVRFIYDESVFRFVLRIDGQPIRASALTPYKGGATSTQGHFITLETRT